LRLAVVFFLLYACLAFPAYAVISFDRTEIDFGFVYRDQPQKVVFPFENRSSDSLWILEIEPSCDCTTAQMVPGVVGPGDRGEILVFMDPMGYEGRGMIEEYIRLLTTDSQAPEVLLTFTITVGIGPEVQPRSLAFGRICNGESDSLRLVVRPGDDPEVRILGAGSDTSCLRVEDLGRNSEGFPEFLVVVTNLGAYGRLSAFVSIATSDSLRPEIRVPVSASLAGNIIVEPDVVMFGPTLPGNYVTQTIMIYYTADIELNALNVVCHIAEIEPELARVGESGYELKLKVKENSPAGRLMGKITVEPSCEGEPPVEIKVTGYVRNRAE
jgi:hypothetical protein